MMYFSFIRCRRNNASVILRSAFCCCVSMKLADIVKTIKSAVCHAWFNDYIGGFSRATKPRPQKLAKFIDRLTFSASLSYRYGAIEIVLLLLLLITSLSLSLSLAPWAQCPLVSTTYFTRWVHFFLSIANVYKLQM